jgi:leucyl-tRNA synthetase
VTQDLERFHFNKAVARIRELTNALSELEAGQKGAPAVARFGLENALRLLNPMIPHLTEECWKLLGHATLLADTPWPEADPTLLTEDTVTVAIQVNGKLRATVDLPKDADARLAEETALSQGPVAAMIAGKTVRKVIVVPNRIVNVVV